MDTPERLQQVASKLRKAGRSSLGRVDARLNVDGGAVTIEMAVPVGQVSLDTLRDAVSEFQRVEYMCYDSVNKRMKRHGISLSGMETKDWITPTNSIVTLNAKFQFRLASELGDVQLRLLVAEAIMDYVEVRK
jgi:hypothetical protein